MNSINFQLMNRTELRKYISKHPEDRQAFHAYMDMLSQEPCLVNGNVNDLQDVQKVTQIIEQVTTIKQRNKNS